MTLAYAINRFLLIKYGFFYPAAFLQVGVARLKASKFADTKKLKEIGLIRKEY